MDRLLGAAPDWVGAEGSAWLGFLAERLDVSIGPEDETAARRWPDSLRSAPWAARRLLLEGDRPPPVWSLVRQLDCGAVARDDAAFTRLVGAGHLDHLTCLVFASTHLTWRSLAVAMRELPALRYVWVGRLDWRGADPSALAPGVAELAIHPPNAGLLRGLLDAGAGGPLRALAVHGTPSGDDPWWESSLVGELHGLHLRGCRLSTPALSALASSFGPQLEGLSLVGAPQPFEPQALASADLSGLRRLDLTESLLATSQLSALRSVSWLPELRALGLSRTGVDEPTFLELAPRLAGLEQLGLRDTTVGAAGIEAVGTDKLRRLDLYGTPLDDDGLRRVLTRSPQLEELTVGGAAVGDAVMCEVGAQVPLPSLASLSLPSTRATGRTLDHLLTGADLPALHTLDLTGCRLEDVGCGGPVRRLNLRRLWLEYSGLTAADPTRLFDPQGLGALESLRVTGERADRSVASAIAELAGSAPLRELSVSTGAHWSVNDLAPIVRAAAPTLVRLSVEASGAPGGALLRALADTPSPALTELHLSSIRVSPGALAELVAGNPLPSLHTIDVGETDLRDIEALACSPLLRRLADVAIIMGSFDPARATEAFSSSPHVRPWTLVSLE